MHYALVQTVAPTQRIVTLAAMKSHLRVSGTDDDDLITALIDAATDYIESYLARQLVSATYEMTLDAFPAVISMPRPPLQSVTSITYVDTNGDTQTLDSDEYTVDSDSYVGRIMPAYGTAWPTTRAHIQAVTVTFVAGYGAGADSGSGSGGSGDTDNAVPASVIAACKLLVGDMYEHREARTEMRIEDNPTVSRLLWPHRAVIGGDV